MTTQIDDKFKYKGKEYSVAGISEPELIDPSSAFGLEPLSVCTACWRGYQACFAVIDSHLVLDDLYVYLFSAEQSEDSDLQENSVEGEIPEINDVSPIKLEDMDSFNTLYRGLNYQLDYTGGLLIADGFIQGLYVHMGFQKPWKYETVIELLFEEGKLIKKIDQSEKMAEFRENLLDPDNTEQQPGYESISQYVDESFDRSYGIEDEGTWGKA